jgi:hypothetical protein
MRESKETFEIKNQIDKDYTISMKRDIFIQNIIVYILMGFKKQLDTKIRININVTDFIQC